MTTGMKKLTGKDAGDAFERYGTANLHAAMGHLGAIIEGVPLAELGKRDPPDLADLFAEVRRQIHEHGDVETGEGGWTFALAEPIDAPNGDRVEQLRLAFPDYGIAMALNAPAASRAGAAKMRWQISRLSGLPVKIIEMVYAGDYLFVAEIVGAYVNEAFAKSG